MKVHWLLRGSNPLKNGGTFLPHSFVCSLSSSCYDSKKLLCSLPVQASKQAGKRAGGRAGKAPNKGQTVERTNVRLAPAVARRLSTPPNIVVPGLLRWGRSVLGPAGSSRCVPNFTQDPFISPELLSSGQGSPQTRSRRSRVAHNALAQQTPTLEKASVAICFRSGDSVRGKLI